MATTQKFKLQQGSKAKTGLGNVSISLGKDTEAQKVHNELKSLAAENCLTVGATTLQLLRFALDNLDES